MKNWCRFKCRRMDFSREMKNRVYNNKLCRSVCTFIVPSIHLPFFLPQPPLVRNWPKLRFQIEMNCNACNWMPWRTTYFHISISLHIHHKLEHSCFSPCSSSRPLSSLSLSPSFSLSSFCLRSIAPANRVICTFYFGFEAPLFISTSPCFPTPRRPRYIRKRNPVASRNRHRSLHFLYSERTPLLFFFLTFPYEVG